MKAYFYLSSGSGIGAHLKQLQLCFSLCQFYGFEFGGVHGIGQRSGIAERTLFKNVSIRMSLCEDGSYINDIDDTLIRLQRENLRVTIDGVWFRFRGWGLCKSLLKLLQEMGLYNSAIFGLSREGTNFLCEVNNVLKNSITSDFLRSLDNVTLTKRTVVIHLRLGDTAVFKLNERDVLSSWYPVRSGGLNDGHSPKITTMGDVELLYPPSDTIINRVEEYVLEVKKRQGDVCVVLLTDGFNHAFERIRLAKSNSIIQASVDEIEALEQKYHKSLSALMCLFNYSIVGETVDAIFDSMYLLVMAPVIVRTHGSFADSVSSLLRVNSLYRLVHLLSEVDTHRLATDTVTYLSLLSNK